MKLHKTSNCGVYAPEELPEDDYEETDLPEVDFGFASGNAKGGQMCNPIGFGKKQRIRFPLHMRYKLDGKNICLQLFTEVDGKHIPLIVGGNKQFRSAFVALLYELFGDDYYEQ